MLYLDDPHLRPDEILPPTRRQQSPGEHAFFRKLRTRMLKRALWKIGAVPVHAGVIAVIAVYGAQLTSPWSGPPVNVAAVPQATTDRLSAEFLLLQEAKAPLFKATESTVESPIESRVQTAPFQPTVPSDIKPTENGVEAGSPPQKEALSLTPSQDASTCFPSASAVRRNYPEERPSWTLRAAGHEGTRCWYPKKQTAPDTRRKETLQIAELEVLG